VEASVGNQGMYCQYVHRFLFVVLYKSMYIGAIALIFTANAIPSQNSRLVQTYSINVNQSHVQFFFWTSRYITCTCLCFVVCVFCVAPCVTAHRKILVLLVVQHTHEETKF